MSIIAGYMVPHPPMAVPEVGGRDIDIIPGTMRSYDEVAKDIAALKPDTMLLSSPHQILYGDYFHISPGHAAVGDFSRFGAGNVEICVDYDEELVKRITSLCDKTGFPAGTMGERSPVLDHGTMVPLYFVNKYYTNYKLVRIGLSGLSPDAHYSFGRIIAQAVNQLGRKAVFIASGDLSHCQKETGPYGFSPEGPVYDEKLMEVMGRGAFEELLTFDEELLEKSQECGHRSFIIMAGAFHDVKHDQKTLSHESITGVGYGFGIYHSLNDGQEEPMHNNHTIPRSKDPYVALAQYTIETCISNGTIPDVPEDTPEELLNRRAGAFVSIHENGLLRGCIGTISATRANLASEIIHNAISASTEDPRFKPITVDELPDLEINVDVLGDAEDISSPAELDVKRYGVIVQNGMRRGLLLPDLDGVDTVDEQIAIACQKAGISPDEPITLKRFEVVRHI
ncbi:MAG: AmmeMemoRadiSam system protein A [Lachnospiraceae bacterium]|nr:AmmeMemoRadiSam system protein A [Lachnospiraceae bacterium]